MNEFPLFFTFHLLNVSSVNDIKKVIDFDINRFDVSNTYSVTIKDL